MKTWTPAAKGGIALVLAASAAILVSRGLRQFVGYDALWNVFIARQNTWDGFWQEVLQNAHPPLYYLFLKASLWLPGAPPLNYRIVSIASVLISTLLLADIFRQITRNQPLAVVAAAAFGLSFSAIDIGLEARAYALGIAFMLVAYRAYLEWLGKPAARVPIRVRVTFAVALTASLLTHYASFFFLAAALSVPVLLAVFHVRWRVRAIREITRRPLHLGLMFGIPVVVAASEYWAHTRSAVGLNNHVKDFLYDPGRESMLEFLARTTRLLAQLFLPDFGWNATVAAAVMAGLFLLMWGIAVRGFSRRRLLMVPLVFVTVMWLLNIVAALLAGYPYGGEQRHELHLFVFSLIALFCGIECARRISIYSWISRHAWTTVAACAVAANLGIWLSASPVMAGRLMQPQMDTFRGLISSPPAILVDQFNFILLFIHHDTADWNLVWQDRSANPWQIWAVTRDELRFKVCRSNQWMIDFSSPDTYMEAADCLDLTQEKHVAIFRPQQRYVTPTWNTKAAKSFARELAPKAGLDTEVIEVFGDDVYALFRFLPHLAANDRRIGIMEARYGLNCGAPTGNATIPVRKTCDGR